MRLKSSRICGEAFSRNWTPMGYSTGKRHSSMRPSSLQKKGASGREDQEGKGDKVSGGGRWQGSSSGKPYRLCFASRGQARGKDTPRNQSPQERAGETSNPTQKSDRRQGIRQRPSSEETQETWYQLAFSSSTQPQECQQTGRPTMGSVQETIYRGENLQLVRELSALNRPIRASDLHVQRLHSDRLHHDRRKTLMRFCNQL